MAFVNLINSKGDDTHPTTFTSSLVCNSKPHLANSSAKTAPLAGFLFDAINKVTIIADHRMVFFLEALELAFKFRMGVNDYFHA
jgi:hypothetical protein